MRLVEEGAMMLGNLRAIELPPVEGLALPIVSTMLRYTWRGSAIVRDTDSGNLVFQAERGR
jgi:hypothetical protein